MERERERSLGAVAAAGYSSMGVRSGEQEPKNGRSRRLLLLLSLLFFVFFFFFYVFWFSFVWWWVLLAFAGASQSFILKK